ncbi:AAA family ATPase, partial [Loktanella sp. DJP18]|uniref:AAA family ATPase n=1 Tax=Loktanella sp. DJP18 TaxID=3409788 RepID=UPI003BB4EEC5
KLPLSILPRARTEGAQLKAGIFEKKGVALLGPSGAGKSRIVDEVIKEYVNLADATGGREFGSRILSIFVPGAASVKDTCREILLDLGYAIQSNRDGNYLWRLVKTKMKLEKIAAIHLDEAQYSGRFKTNTSMANFANFRNMMQDRDLTPSSFSMSTRPSNLSK